MHHRERGRAGRADAGRRAGHRQDGALGGRRRGRPAARLPRARAPQRRGRGGLRVRWSVGSGCAGLRRGRRRARAAPARGAGGRAAAPRRGRRAAASRRRSGWRCWTSCGRSPDDAPCSSRWTTCSGWTLVRLGAARCAAASRGRARRAARDVRGTPGLRAWEPTRAAGAVARRRCGSRGVHALLRERLGVELARPQLARLHELSGGNPFFALELARVHRTAASRRACAICSAAASPSSAARPWTCCCWPPRSPGRRKTWSAPRTATRTVRARRSTAAGDVIVDEDGRLRFTHPLLASLCYERAAPSRRRDAHRGSPTSSPTVEERARHLALATTEPDAGGRRRSSTPPRPMRRRAGRRSPRPSSPSSPAARTPAANRDRTDNAGSTAAAAAVARGRPGPGARDPRRARRSTPPGVERADLLTSWRSAAGSTMPTRVALCEQGARGGRRRRRPRDRAPCASSRIYRWFAGEIRAGLARAARRWAGRRLGDPRLLVIAQGRRCVSRDLTR